MLLEATKHDRQEPSASKWSAVPKYALLSEHYSGSSLALLVAQLHEPGGNLKDSRVHMCLLAFQARMPVSSAQDTGFLTSTELRPGPTHFTLMSTTLNFVFLQLHFTSLLDQPLTDCRTSIPSSINYSLSKSKTKGLTGLYIRYLGPLVAQHHLVLPVLLQYRTELLCADPDLSRCSPVLFRSLDHHFLHVIAPSLSRFTHDLSCYGPVQENQPT